MDSIISKLWCPLEIHRDQRKNVDDNVIRKLFELLEIIKTRTRAYHRASNDQFERYNCTLAQMIRCFTKKRQDSWDVHLQQFTGAIRATENRQTGFTPNFMFFGKENIQPIDLVLGLDAPHRTREQTELTDYIKILRKALTEIHVLARENIKMAQWRQKRDYDLNVNCKVYRVGNIVFKIDSVRNIWVCPKLKTPWEGSFVVAEVQSPVLYKIRNKKTSEGFHHDRLKLSQIHDLPIWTQGLMKRILEYSKRKILDD
ncbi:Hypothetical predicted protein [Mytilus galloprovincialis]|uniref:Integrase catalytic domain-containing protein n=1 Tax=Mytilus galloprovincialis TaxID=29158 RepID=A0A8B6FQS9_MYTGA|nr:Hypothetical predicted protein [Mytilus galloprovincialis]